MVSVQLANDINTCTSINSVRYSGLQEYLMRRSASRCGALQARNAMGHRTRGDSACGGSGAGTT